MAERLYQRPYRVTGVAKFHLPPSASDETVAQAVTDVRRWKREHDNDADIGNAYEVDVEPGRPRGESAEFFLHLNDVEAATLSAALTSGLMTLRSRLQSLGRHSDDAYFIEIDAVRQRKRVSGRV